jgi:hypothetical protein
MSGIAAAICAALAGSRKIAVPGDIPMLRDVEFVTV